MIPPGSTIGILGGGQLGRMSILAGRRLGYRFHVYEPSTASCAAPLAEHVTHAPYDDVAALRAFAASVDVVTLEFENVSTAAMDALESAVPVRPGKHVLHTCQHRIREKEFLRDNGFQCAPFAVIRSASDLEAALPEIGTPSVLKTATLGYDGKGQVKIDAVPADIGALWDQFGSGEAVLEGWVDFAGECSAICSRNDKGQTAVFPVAENIHTDHILDLSVLPASFGDEVARNARETAIRIAEAIGLEGLLAVEFFVTRDGGLLVNELAPRPHNSGHYTIDACTVSQFEQHIRAVCGLPPGDTALRCPAVMGNLLGDLWRNGEPHWERLLAEPDACLHLYDKGEPRIGRKMGHFTVLGKDSGFLRKHVISLREGLTCLK